MKTASKTVPVRGCQIILLLGLMLLGNSSLLAQTDDGNEDNVELDSVIVTAQKRPEDAQKVSKAISTLSGEKLDVYTSGGMDIRFLNARLPSLQIESSFGRAFPRFYIRGYGNTDFDVNASQPVSLVYDEVVQENPILKGFPAFDLERVEMLRGPQGTLFGRNTPAGIVKFDSVKPSQSQESYAQVAFGTFNRTLFEGAVGGAFTDAMSGRFSLQYQRRDDWVDNAGFVDERNVLEGYDELAWRGQIRHEADGLDVLFNVHGRDNEGSARLFRANIIQPGTNNLVPGFDVDDVFTDGINEQDLEQIGFNLRVTYDMGDYTFTSVTGYEDVEVFSRGDIDGGYGASFIGVFGPGFIPFPSESAVSVPDHQQITQEFRIASNDLGAFDWQGGLFYFSEDITIDNFGYDSLSPGNPRNIVAQQRQDTTAWGVFISGDYDVTDQFRIQAGLRYSNDEKDFVAIRTESPFADPIGPLRERPEDDEISWDLSATYDFSDDVNVYTRVSKGFRAPSVQGRISFGDTTSVADSETILSWEAGVKSTLLDRRLRLNASIYTYTVDDLQLTAVGGVSNVTELLNADKAKGNGLEIELEALLTADLLLTAGYSYNDTEIDDPNLYVAGCGSGCTVLDPENPNNPGQFLIDGNRLPQAPENVFNLTLQYARNWGPGEFFVFADYAYRDEVSFFLYDSIEYTGKSLGELGLRTGYRWGQWQELAVFVRNLTDEVVIVGGIDFNNLTGFVNEPRTFGIEYKYEF
ncbi:TonB-dependent receptor [Marinicella meishanensis]|uniref:TonB-dependent receptor n=1 Tax=Marinicella meishanensis TaxID=2873263 RepID=UPI001CBD44CF|nr:TonB-dependent receptor [Marinicella sp. NBU2979]